MQKPPVAPAVFYLWGPLEKKKVCLSGKALLKVPQVFATTFDKRERIAGNVRYSLTVC
jgi:hypothetical protein